MNWDLVSNFAIAMLAIVNPIEKIPLWVAASRSDQRGFKWLLAALVISSCALILLFFLWFGQLLLTRLNIDLASFKIGGGLILLQFGFNMMKGTAIDMDKLKEGKSTDLTTKVLKRYQQIFIPIGVPVIAGPGALTTVIIYGHQSDSIVTSLLLSATVIGVLAVLYATLLGGSVIQRLTGQLPLELISILLAVGSAAISLNVATSGCSR